MIPIYFTHQGASDTEAGLIFGVVGVIIGFLAIILGPFINRFGCKRGLLISNTFSLIGFSLLLITRNFLVNLLAVSLFLTTGCALSWPVVELGSKLYTKSDAWNTSNSILLIGNFISGIIAGTSIDYIWSSFSDDKSYSIIYMIAVISSFVALLASVSLRHDQNVDEGEKDEINITKTMLKTKKFWRFVGLISLLILLRSGCFGHLDATFPKYLLRKHGNKVHFGRYLALHSTTMLIGTIGFTPLSYAKSSYNLIAIGGIMGATAPFFLYFGSSSFYEVIFVIIISAGESL